MSSLPHCWSSRIGCSIGFLASGTIKGVRAMAATLPCRGVSGTMKNKAPNRFLARGKGPKSSKTMVDLEPLGPDASGKDRRDLTTREMRNQE